MADVVFVNPANKFKLFADAPPLGMLAVASFLANKGVSVELVDCEVDNRSVSSIIKKHSPSILCVGGTTETRFESFRIASAAKSVDKKIWVIYGGAHASLTPRDTLERIPCIDIVAVGDAQKAIFQIASGILSNKPKLECKRGIAYRKSGKIVLSKPASCQKDFQHFFVDYGLFELGKYNLKLDFFNKKAASVITSMGCPFNCSFCSIGSTSKGYFRRPVKSVVDEIEFLTSKYGYDAIKFFDSTLTLDYKYIKSLCKEIKERRLEIIWECESRADVMNKSLLSLIKSAGCHLVDFGLESASQRILNKTNKMITVSQASMALHNARELGMHTKMFFIYGLPDEKMDDALKTLRFVKLNRSFIDILSVQVCTIYPGTDVETFALRNELLPKDFSWSTPYCNYSYVRDFNASPFVPKLVQPDLNQQMLRQLLEETYKESLSFSLLKRKIHEIGTKKGLGYSLKEAYKSVLFHSRYH